MAPKASAAAQQVDRSCPILKLIMKKGPLSGQALDFRPRSGIRVGRVVRGNTLTIKDDGISSQHLLIQSEPTSDPGRLHWTITDLGSSNGTVLNGSQIQASIPVSLSDGDVVKIGETTAIKVKFEVNEGESEVKSGNTRRYVKRRGKNKGTELGVIDENSELESGGNDLGNRYNLRGKGGKNANMRTRSSKEDETLLVEFKGVSCVSGQIVSSRRTRSSRKEENWTSLEGEAERKSNLQHKAHREEEKGKFEAAVDVLVEEGINSGSQGDAGFASTSGVVGNQEPVADLEKMTLGEWFDFLEVYLPKQIIDTTEEMISGMRQTAEKLHEFMLEQKNVSNTDELAKD